MQLRSTPLLLAALATACGASSNTVVPSPSERARGATPSGDAGPAASAEGARVEATSPSPDATPPEPCRSAADPDACRAASLTAEGDESLVALAGTFFVADAIFGSVTAVGIDEVEPLFGSTAHFVPELSLPGASCSTPRYRHRSVSVSRFLDQVNAEAIDAETARVYGLAEGDLTEWTVSGCPGAPIITSTTTGFVLVGYGEAAGALLVLEMDAP